MEMTPPVLPSVAYLPHPLAIDARKFLPATYAPTRTLRDHLIATGIDPHREIVVFVNHRLLEVAEWDVLVPVPGDCIVVEAVVSGGDGSNPIASLLSIALMVFAPMLGEALNVALFSAESSFAFALSNAALGGLIAIGGNMMISKIFSAQQPSSASKSIKQESPTYSLSGGSNRLRPYEPLPLLMGQHRIFPDYGAKPYTEFEGDDQYLYQVFNFGIGSLVLEDLRIGETLLSSYSDVTVTRASGATLPGFWGNVDTAEGAALTYAAGWVTRTTGQDTQRIAVDIVGTFYRIDDDGDLRARSATFGLEYCETGTNNWQPFIPGQVQAAQYYWSRGAWQEVVSDPYYGEDDVYHPGETSLVWVQDSYDTNLSPYAHTDGGMLVMVRIWRWVPVGTDPYPANSYINSLSQIELKRASTKPLRKTIVRDVPAGQYDVRVRRLVPDETDASASSSAEWAAMRSYQTGTADYTGQTVLGIKIKATAQLNGVIEQFSALGTRAISQWDGTAWITAPSTNPAWWFLDLARGWRDSAGRLWYGGGLADSRIDLEGLKAWATFCTANGLSFSAVFDSSQTLADALNTIARCGFGSCSWASGKLGVVWDAPNQSPVMAFGMSNIVKGSFEVAYVTSNLADEIIVNYTNRNRNWESDQVRVTVPGTVGTPVKPSPIDLMGCTVNAMAGKFANAMAAQQKYRRRAITWEADFEGMVCQRGDVVILSHDLTQWGYSGRLVSVAGNTVTLSRTVPRGTGTDYLMIERPDGSMVTASIPAGTGETDTLTLSTPITLQDGYGPLEHKWFFSPLPTPGKKVKISGVQPLSAARIRLTATDEYPEYYAAWNGVFTAPPRQTLLDQNQVSVSDLALTLNQVIVDAYQLNRVTAAWRQRGPVESCTVSAWLDGQAVGTWTGVRDASHVIDLSEQTGTLIVEVTPLAASGPGAPVRATINLSTLPAPAAPVLTVTGGLFMVEATWVFGDARSDVAYTELWFASTNNRGVAQRLTTQPYPSTRFQQLGMQPGYGGYYWARVVDTRKNQSAWFPVSATGGLHATATTDPNLLLQQLHEALGEDELAAGLASRIDLIDGPASEVGTVNNRIATLQGQIDAIAQTQDYDNAETYSTGDVVKYNGGLYKANSTTTGHLPTDTGYWTKIGDYSSLADAVAAHTSQIATLTGTDAALAKSVTTLAARVTSAEGNITTATAAVQNESTARASADTALSSQISTVQSTLNGNIAAVQNYAEAVAGDLGQVEARWGVKVQAMGDGVKALAGIELLSGSSGQSTVAVLADKFLVYQPNGSGAPKQIFSMGTVNGVAALGFNGSAIFDGSIVGRTVAAKTLTVEHINTNGLDIRKADGTLIFGANTPLSSEYIGVSFSDNLAPNPDLFSGDGTTTAAGWTAEPRGGNPLYRLRYVTQDNLAPPWNNGQPVFYTYADSTDDAFGWLSDPIPVDESKVYCLSVWALGYSNPRCYLGLVYYDASGNAITYNYPALAASSLSAAWARYYGTVGPGQPVTFPVGTKTVRIRWIGQYLQVGGTMATRFGFNLGLKPTESYSQYDPSTLGKYNPITAANITTYIAGAAIDYAQIKYAAVQTLNVAAGAITYSNFLEQSGKWYLGENSKTTVLSMNIDCGYAMGGIVELDWAVGMGTDQISKRYWAVTVRVYRDSTILREMNSNVINLASKSQQVPDYIESTDENGNAILIESGNYVYPTSLSRFKLTDYYAPAGVHTYSIWVWVRHASGTPYTWINERSMWTKFTKR